MRSIIYYTCLTATLFYTTDVTQGYIPPLISNQVPSSSTIHKNQYQKNMHSLYENSRYSKTQLGTNTIQIENENEKISLFRSLGKPFSGLKGDLKRRLPYYQTDWSDGFRRKSLASILFLYFACLGIHVYEYVYK
jgi:hypothetical protein